MTSRRRITVFVLLAGGALALVVGLRLAREPVYGGKGLSAWLAALGEDTHEKRMPAVEAIRHIGTNAAPAVIRLLRYEESALKRKVRELAAKQSLVKLSFEEPRRRRQRGLIACDALGPAAVSVIPTLINLLTNQQPPEPHIPYLLARIGRAAIPALDSALTNDEKVIRMGAKHCLELLRTNAVFLHPENRPVEEQDYYLRTCQYNLMMLQNAAREYAAQHGGNFMDVPHGSLPDDFAPKAFEALLERHATEPPQTNVSSPFE